MPETKKLTAEELQQIKDMQAQYNKFVFDLGNIESQLQNLLSAKAKIEEEKNNILNDIKKLGEREKELVNILQEKYGNGSIDIETGEVTTV